MSRADTLAKNDQEVQDYVLQFKQRPNGPTPAQFLSDDSLASTEFVQRALGSFSGIVGYTAAGTLNLTAADIGKHIVVNNATTIVLPAASSVVPGATLHILVSGVTDAVVTRAGTDVISRNDAMTVNSISVKANTSIILRQGLGGTAWIVCGGDASLSFSPLFAAAMSASSANQQLPGLIIKAGNIANASTAASIPLTFPVSFPNACVALILTPWQTAGNSYSHSGRDKSGATISRGSSAAYYFDYLAIGY